MSASALRLTRPWSPAGVAAALARARGRADGRPPVASLLGVEHEYRVSDAAGARVDFRTLLPALPAGGRALDPGDRHALRLPWGAALTADDAEAEVALPPLAGRAGAATRAASLAERARADLAALLPAGLRLEGYSTHLSVALPDDLADGAARVYARTFAPALMLLLDGPDAPGLLVRPRPGRLELGGDYRSGEGLAAALLFAVGSVLAVARAIRAGRADRLPPLLAVAPAGALERHGWYVDRRAFGGDLYAQGRAATLPLAGGGSIRASDLLRVAWAIARRELRGRASADELALVDARVGEAIPLPCEAPGDAAPPMADRAFRAPEGRILDDIARPGFTLRATLATWELAVFEVEGRRRAALSVPRAELGAFLAAAATGRLDAAIERFLARPRAGEILASRAEALAGTRLWDGVGDPRLLLATEPDGSGGSEARTAARVAGTAARAAWRAGRLAGINLDGLDEMDEEGDGDGRPGKRRGARARRDERREPPEQTQLQAQPQPSGAPLPAPVAPAPAAALPIVPIIAGFAGVAGVAALLAVSGVFGGRTPTPTPAPTTAAAVVTSAPAPGASATPLVVVPSPASPSAGVPTPAPTPSPSPTAPPLSAARIAGTFSGEDGSYSITVTPACATGACDGTAAVLSPPFAADAPRGTITMAFTGAAGVYGGSGSGEVPFCRTGAGRILTASPTYTLSGFRATAAAFVDGDWVATAVAGEISYGSAEVSGDGTTCTSGSPAPVPVALGVEPAGPAPSATAPAEVEPPLADARIDGNYSRTEDSPDSVDLIASCPTGPCSTTMVLVEAPTRGSVRTDIPLSPSGGRYSGTATARGVGCENGALVNIPYQVTDLVVRGQERIDGVWTATRLSGTFIVGPYRQYSGPGCRSDGSSVAYDLVRRGEVKGGGPPPLANARFEGTYVGEVSGAFSFNFRADPDCGAGACSVAMTYDNYLVPSAKVPTTVPLKFSGGAYGGRSTTPGLLCAVNSRVDVTQVFSGLKPTKQKQVNGTWIATELKGKIRRLAFQGFGCEGLDETASIVLVRK